MGEDNVPNIVYLLSGSAYSVFSLSVLKSFGLDLTDTTELEIRYFALQLNSITELVVITC